jgi:PAS domain S-box-containing protein
LSISEETKEPKIKRADALLSPARVVIVVTLAIFVIETLEMSFFQLLPTLSPLSYILLDGFLLIILISPALYYFLFRPLVMHVNERKKAEKLVVLAKEEWERTFDAVAEGIVFIKGSYRIARVNRAMADRLGLPPGDCVGQICYKLIHGKSEPPPHCPHALLLKDRQEHAEEIHEERLGGDFLISCSPVYDSQRILTGSVHVFHDITERKKAEKELVRHREHLEELVKERASELIKINESLKQEIAERERVESALRKRKEELKIKTDNLEEVNTALKVMLGKKGEVKNEVEENVMKNVKELVAPYLEKLKKNTSDSQLNGYLDILESNLNDITSSFSANLSSRYLKLTPTEVKIANLIKYGKSTKEIAETLVLSSTTVEFHRRNIRKKLGIRNKKANLRTYLASLK